MAKGSQQLPDCGDSEIIMCTAVKGMFRTEYYIGIHVAWAGVSGK